VTSIAIERILIILQRSVIPPEKEVELERKAYEALEVRFIDAVMESK
jgi:hypothetical protein